MHRCCVRRTDHVAFICAHILLGVSALTKVNIAIFSANQIPAQQLTARSVGIYMTTKACLMSSEIVHYTGVFIRLKRSGTPLWFFQYQECRFSSFKISPYWCLLFCSSMTLVVKFHHHVCFAQTSHGFTLVCKSEHYSSAVFYRLLIK